MNTELLHILGKTQVLIGSAKGEEAKQCIAYLKRTNQVEETVKAIPDFRKFGRTIKLSLDPNLVLDLKWSYRSCVSIYGAE